MKASFQIQKPDKKIRVFGIWDKNSIFALDFSQILSEICKEFNEKRELFFDFNELEKLDTAGICFLLALENDLKKRDFKINRENLNVNFQTLFALCEKNYQRISQSPKKRAHLAEFFVKIGRLVYDLFKILKRFVEFVGLFFSALFEFFKNPRLFRFISFLYHIENSALKALPIVILTTLLVGIVLAFQAAFQLAQFGANIFIVDLTGISTTRELAPLIVAIIIAGRSASSNTAQIGVMKLTEEIAAMNTMGLKSVHFISIPRVIALVFAMPFLVAVGDLISILGAMFVAKFNLDINFIEFLRRFKEAVDLKHILIGLIKAPVFGFLIGLIACFRGFEVQNTTQSIGIYTTKSVVEAIFWVIAFDALFSIILTKMGI